MTWTPATTTGHPYFGKNLNIFAFIRHSVVVKNESWDFFIAGPRGDGKSTAAFAISRMIDKEFGLDQIMFTQDEYIDYLTTKHKKGTVVFYDDIGTQQSGSSRKWQKKEAHDLADIAQVNRPDGIITIATSIEQDRSEKRFRTGFKIIIQPRRKLSNIETGGKGLAIDVELRVIEYDVFTDTQFKKLWRYCPGGRVKLVRIYHPDDAMWREYSAKRENFLLGIKNIPSEVAVNAAYENKIKYWSAIFEAPRATLLNLLSLCKKIKDDGALDQSSFVSKEYVIESGMEIFGIARKSMADKIPQMERREMIVQGKENNRTTQKNQIWLGAKGLEFIAAFEEDNGQEA